MKEKCIPTYIEGWILSDILSNGMNYNLQHLNNNIKLFDELKYKSHHQALYKYLHRNY